MRRVNFEILSFAAAVLSVVLIILTESTFYVLSINGKFVGWGAALAVASLAGLLTIFSKRSYKNTGIIVGAAAAVLGAISVFFAAYYSVQISPRIEAHFSEGGFASRQSRSFNQGPTGGCECGPATLNLEPAKLAGQVNGSELHLQWDASEICMGLTIEDSGGTMEVSKDEKLIESLSLPYSYGNAYLKFSTPGHYSALLRYHGGCRNIFCNKQCSMTATAPIDIR
ncbi:MAG TPA: hypothetical protein VGL53_30655 [Bryobacteraceae bacterium]